MAMLDLSVIVVLNVTVMFVVHSDVSVVEMVVVMLQRRSLYLAVMIMLMLMKMLMFEFSRVLHFGSRLMIVFMTVVVVIMASLFLLGRHLDNLVDRVNVLVLFDVGGHFKDNLVFPSESKFLK